MCEWRKQSKEYVTRGRRSLYNWNRAFSRILFFSSLLSRERQREKKCRLYPWQLLTDANVLVHFSLLLGFFPLLRLFFISYVLICYCRFFIFSPFVVIQESAKKKKKEKSKKRRRGYADSALQVTCNAQTSSELFIPEEFDLSSI
jgi:hypothetical protein